MQPAIVTKDFIFTKKGTRCRHCGQKLEEVESVEINRQLVPIQSIGNKVPSLASGGPPAFTLEGTPSFLHQSNMKDLDLPPNLNIKDFNPSKRTDI